MKCVMPPFHVHYTVTNVLLLPLMSENAPYTGLYIGPLLNVCPGALWIDHIWIFDMLFRPPDAFCMSLYCQKEKWAILTPSTLPYPFECLNLQAQCFRTCHCVSFTSQNISELLPLLLMLSWIKHTPKMRNTPKSDICLTFPSLSGIRKIVKKCHNTAWILLQMIPWFTKHGELMLRQDSSRIRYEAQCMHWVLAGCNSMFTSNLSSNAYVSAMARYDLTFTWIICR